MTSHLDSITNDSTYMLAKSRLKAALNSPLRSADEEAELDSFADGVERYYQAHIEAPSPQMDGVDELAFRLDMGMLTLPEVLSVFGGHERFASYMTRQRDLDAVTLEALVNECGVDRSELEKPLCEPPGWQELSLDGRGQCDNPKCCTPGERDWRVVLAAGLQSETRELAEVAD